MKVLQFIFIANVLFLSYGLEIKQPNLQIVDAEYDPDPTEVAWERVNNGTGILSRSKSTLELFCTAEYPIQWKITGFVVRRKKILKY